MAGTDRFTADPSAAAVPFPLPAPARGLLLLGQKWTRTVRTMMSGKLHRATITDANIGYEGSITLDADLLELRRTPSRAAEAAAKPASMAPPLTSSSLAKL